MSGDERIVVSASGHDFCSLVEVKRVFLVAHNNQQVIQADSQVGHGSTNQALVGRNLDTTIRSSPLICSRSSAHVTSKNKP